MTIPRLAAFTVSARPPQRSRGSIVLLTGRGEGPKVYQRLAERLAFDGYDVTVQTSPPPQLGEIAQDRPLFLVGSDTGAILAAALAVKESVSGVVLSGLPGRGDPDLGDSNRDAEIASRASCPTQQSRLTHADVLRVGALRADDVPALPASLSVPVLALHGANDAISPIELAKRRYAELGVRELVVVDDGRHDPFNSIHHRVVAATVVVFLEQVRSGDALSPVARAELSASWES